MADCSEHAKTLTEIAMNLASRKGINNLDDVVTEMQKLIPDIRRQSLVDAIVEATEGQNKETDETTKLLRGIRQEARTDKKLRKKIGDLETYLKEGTLPKGQARNVTNTPEAIQRLRDIRDDLKKKIRTSKPAVVKRLQDSIARLQEKIDTNNIFPKVREKLFPQDKQVQRLEFERDQLKQQISLTIALMKPRGIWEHIADPFNTARALMTSLDLSAVLRQGGFIVIGNPTRAAKAMPAMFRAMLSEKARQKINKEIRNRPNAPLYKKAGLFLSDILGKLTQFEEAYMTRWAAKIPGIAASERAYSTFLNKLRADTFDTLVATLTKGGQPTLQEIQVIANFINVATGRGSLGSLEKNAIALNTVFFAPRYVTSRFQLMVGQPLFKGTARTRKLIAGEYARFLIGMGTVYLLANMIGGDTEPDPRSSDFGKIRFGNTRLDPLSGISQTAVVTSRLVTGKIKSTQTGELKSIRGDVKFGQSDSFDILTRFLRYKLSPMFSTAVNVATGEDPVGQPVTPKSTVKNLVIPLAMKDIHETIQEQGLPKGASMGLLSIFGMGLQTYGRHVETMTKREIQFELSEVTYIKDTTIDGIKKKKGEAHKGKSAWVKALKEALKHGGVPKDKAPTLAEIKKESIEADTMTKKKRLLKKSFILHPPKDLLDARNRGEGFGLEWKDSKGTYSAYNRIKPDINK